MTYSEFKKTYPWTVKKYPGTTSLFKENMNETIGSIETVNYEKHGSRWKETGRSAAEMTRANYFNCVDAIPFFRNLGGKERVSLSYTYHGYIPVELSSISPDGKNKTVRKFSFKA